MKKYTAVLLLLLTALFGCSKTHEEYLSSAENYYKNKEYDKALQMYEKACKKGSYKGCLFLAKAYKSGEIVKQDIKISENYYKTAFNLTNSCCQENNKDACKMLGYLYEKGLGTEKDLIKADNASIKACQLGDNVSCYYMARINADNISDFIYFTDKACKLNLASACLTLGNTYLTGFNESMAEIKQDIEKGISYINKACEINSEYCSNLADIYISGDDLSQNYEMAVKYYETALSYYSSLCPEINDDNIACKKINIIKSKYSHDNNTIF